jgi:hypothetical protein
MAISVQRVSANEIPGTKHVGRKRTPTQFDEFMYDMSESGEWIKVSYATDDELKTIVNDLTKASNHFNVGVDKRDDNHGNFYFHVRPRILKPRKAKDESGVEIGQTDSGVEVGQTDNVEQLNGKRSRKAS